MTMRKRGRKKSGGSSSLEQKSAGNDAAFFLNRDDVVLFCKLFSDVVVERLCLLRRRELHAAEDLSCRGCGMDSLMNKEFSFMKDIVQVETKDRSLEKTEIAGDRQQENFEAFGG